MKRLLVPLLAILLFSGLAFAQTGPISRTVPLSLPYGPLIAQASTLPTSAYQWCTPDLSSYPYASHQFIYEFPSGAPNAVTITVTGSTNGSTFSTETTGTTVAGGTISVSGVRTGLCITATTMTGAGVTVWGTYLGIPNIGSVSIDTSLLATAANQTNLSQKAQICDAGGDCTTVTGSKLDVNATVDTTGLATGGKTNNNAVPGATNTGVLPCVANAAAPTYTETFQVACSTDLSGRTRLVAESGGIKSGAVASGAVASGAYASGAFAAGAGTDGWNVTEGTKTDAKCTTSDATSCSMVSLLKELAGLAATDPCTGVAKIKVPIDLASTSPLVVQAASASNKFYICSIYLWSATTVSVAIAEDATAACASLDAGVIGGNTTAKGIVLTSGGQGFVLGNGGSTVAGTASTNVNFCLLASAGNQISGVVTGVLAP